MRCRANGMRLIASVIAMLCLMLYMLQSGTARVISHGQVDDFENGTLQGWRMGSNNVTDSHLAKVADGGPVGISDNFLQLASHDHEMEVSDSRLTFFSQTQWVGNTSVRELPRLPLMLTISAHSKS